jgi:predicted Fe-Mo cluster-binding NifX family protein
MIVCVAVDKDGSVGPRWGRADRVAVASVTGSGIESWDEFDVGWNELHDAGPEGQHHARVARFLQDHGVEAVVAYHVGLGMQQMLGKMGIAMKTTSATRASEAALSAVAAARPRS